MREIFETCIHESGHLWMLRKFRGDGYIEIFKNPINTESEKAVLGRIICTTQPPEAHQVRKISILVGLTGHCAELMQLNPESDWLANELEDFWLYEYHTISESDRKLTEDVVSDDFHVCVNLIQSGYSEIFDTARKQYQRFLCKNLAH